MVKKFVAELREQLTQKGIELYVDDKVFDWLYETGADPAYGARPFARTVDEHVKREQKPEKKDEKKEPAGARA